MEEIVVIEVAETGLRAHGVAGPSVEVPAVALLEDDELLIGNAAAPAARLKPVLSHDRFLAELSQLPLPNPKPRVRTTADLVYASLVELHRSFPDAGAPVVAAIPSHWSAAQAGLFAGIARAAGMPLAGIVDAALAASLQYPAATMLHLDVDLHGSRLVHLGGDGRLRRLEIEATTRAGLKALHAAWAQFIAAAFVRGARLDPMQEGSSEQRLYDALPGWLQRLDTEPVIEAELEIAGGVAAVSLVREQLLLATEAHYAQLLELVARGVPPNGRATLLLSDRAAMLPGLAARLGARRNLAIASLPPDAVASGARSAASEILAAGPTAVCLALARSGHGAVETPSTDRAITARPTHVLHGGRVHALGTVPLVLGRAPDGARRLVIEGPPAGISARHCTLVSTDGQSWVIDHSRHGTFLNGARVSERALLSAGDSLRLGTPGVYVDLVTVESDGTA